MGYAPVKRSRIAPLGWRPVGGFWESRTLLTQESVWSPTSTFYSLGDTLDTEASLSHPLDQRHQFGQAPVIALD